MVVSTRQRAGRGQLTEGRINHTYRIQTGGRNKLENSPGERVAKLTSFLRDREGNLEKKQTKNNDTVDSIKTGTKQIQNQIRGSNMTGKDHDINKEDSTEISKIRLTEIKEIGKKAGNQTYVDKVQTTEPNKTDTAEKQKQADTKSIDELKVLETEMEWDKVPEDTTVGEREKVSQKDMNTNVNRQMNIDYEKLLTPNSKVHVKKEMVEDIVNTGMGKHPKEKDMIHIEDSSMDESVSSWDESDEDRKKGEEEEDELSESSIEMETSLSKRKMMTSQVDQQNKRLNTSKIHKQKQAGVNDQEWGLPDKDAQYTKSERSEKNSSTSVSRGEDEMDTDDEDEVSSGESTVKTKHTTKNEAVDVRKDRTESDIEWEAIASEIQVMEKRPWDKYEKKSRFERALEARENERNKKATNKSKIKIVKRWEKQETTSLQTRGLNMVEEQELITTPVSIEYNLENTVQEFNIMKEVIDLFIKLNQCDKELRIYDTENEKIIWEENTDIENSENLVEDLKVREQTFRKGNKKITLFCIVQSKTTINKLKYMEPVKSYIMGKNVWIKPDFYATKVVTSPGFMTLLHPQITNKKELTNVLINAIETMELSQEEPIVQEWQQKNRFNADVEKMARVPQFHLETATKKWGGIHTEVISVHCKRADARYLKYVLSEAGTQKKIVKGLFIPTGIQLIESPEVLTSLLQEHTKFMSEITGFHLAGITHEEMLQSTTSQKAIQEILLECDGIKTIEPTYQTDSRGHWILVIEKEKIQQVKDFITANLERIYRRRKDKTLSKIIPYNNTNTKMPTGYRLILVERWESTVGTYAEALKNRFPNTAVGKHSKTNGALNEQNPNYIQDQVKDKMVLQGRQASKIVKQSQKRSQKSYSEIVKENNTTVDNINNDVMSVQLEEEIHDSNEPERAANNYEREREIGDTVQVGIKIDDLQTKVDNMEKTFYEKIKELEKANTKLVNDLGTTIEERVDKTMDSKIGEVMTMVANTLTDKMVKMMEQKMQQRGFHTPKKFRHEPVTITQKSPLETIREEVDEDASLKSKKSPEYSKKTNSTQILLTELLKIEKNTATTKDPIHDNKTNGSTKATS